MITVDIPEDPGSGMGLGVDGWFGAFRTPSGTAAVAQAPRETLKEGDVL